MSSSLRNRPPTPPPAAPTKSSLTISKVVAGAGAAATTAVVGSSFGADGTVVGAAVGSVVSALAATTYERSLDRTRRVVVARVRPPGRRDAETTQVILAEATQVIPAQRAGGGARVGEPVAPLPPPRRTRLPLLAAATAAIFLVGLLVVTGVEMFTGGPVLSSQRGTSVGTVLGYRTDPGSSTTASATPSATPAMSSATATPSSSPSTRAARSGAEASGRSDAEGSVAPSATPTPLRTTTVAPAAPGRQEQDQ